MSSEDGLPPKRRIAPQFDVLRKTEQQNNTTAVAEELKKAWESLRLVAPKTEPSLDHFSLLDWTVPYRELPEKAKELIHMIVANCDVSTLQFILKLAKKRIAEDFQLWCLMKEVEEALQLGDAIYRKRRMEE